MDVLEAQAKARGKYRRFLDMADPDIWYAPGYNANGDHRELPFETTSVYDYWELLTPHSYACIYWDGSTNEMKGFPSLHFKAANRKYIWTEVFPARDADTGGYACPRCCAAEDTTAIDSTTPELCLHINEQTMEEEVEVYQDIEFILCDCTNEASNLATMVVLCNRFFPTIHPKNIKLFFYDSHQSCYRITRMVDEVRRYMMDVLI